MSKLNQLLEEIAVGINESGQKKNPIMGWTDSKKKYRPSSFKIDYSFIREHEKETGKPAESILFKRELDHINSIPRQDLPKIFGLDNIPDTQDFLAYYPRKAFQMWMRNIGKVDPKLAKHMQGAASQNIPLYWYAYMVRISGREMADIIFKRYHTAVDEKLFAKPAQAKKLNKSEDANLHEGWGAEKVKYISETAQQVAHVLDWVARAAVQANAKGDLDDNKYDAIVLKLSKMIPVLEKFQIDVEKIALDIDPKEKYLNKQWKWQ